MSFIWDRHTGKIGPARVKVSSSPSYTLADLERLSKQLISQQQGDTEMLKWALSILIEWLAKEEKEREGNERGT